MNEDIRILVLQRGRVVIGRYELDGAMVRLRDSRTVRRWGTSEGLEQLANFGPQSGVAKSGRNTELEQKLRGVREMHILTVIESIQCNAEAWRGHL